MTSTRLLRGTREHAGPGRPRSFDEDAVLDALTALFWRQGYEATSMADIVDVSGLNKSSLYNTFGSKQQLFNTVLERYIDKRIGFLADIIEQSGDGIEGLHRFLDMIQAELGTEMGRQGCLCVNATAELGAGDGTIAGCGHDYRDRMRDVLVGILRAAADSGDLDPDLTEPRADLLMVLMLGIAVAVRGGADDAEIDRLMKAAHTTVETWRR